MLVHVHLDKQTVLTKWIQKKNLFAMIKKGRFLETSRTKLLLPII